VSPTGQLLARRLRVNTKERYADMTVSDAASVIIAVWLVLTGLLAVLVTWNSLRKRGD
jgi:hypothetical protein